MFSPIYEHPRMGVSPYGSNFPYEDNCVLMASPDDVSYSAVKTDEIYFTKKRKPHYCTVANKLVVHPRVSQIVVNTDFDMPRIKIATDYGNIWHLPQKYIDGESTFILYDYWDAVIVFISAVS